MHLFRDQNEKVHRKIANDRSRSAARTVQEDTLDRPVDSERLGSRRTNEMRSSEKFTQYAITPPKVFNVNSKHILSVCTQEPRFGNQHTLLHMH